MELKSKLRTARFSIVLNFHNNMIISSKIDGEILL